MTQQQLPPAFDPFGRAMGYVEPGDRGKLLDEIAKAVIDDDFLPKVDAAIEAMGLLPLPPLSRFRTYLNWTDDHWQEFFAKFPKQAQARWDDFMALKERAARGELAQ